MSQGRIAFQGELGAYGETAIVQHFGVNGSVPVPCDNFESVRPRAGGPLTVCALTAIC